MTIATDAGFEREKGLSFRGSFFICYTIAFGVIICYIITIPNKGGTLC